MSRSRTLPGLVALSLASLVLSSCKAEELALGGNNPGGIALPDIATGTTIESLSDTQATDLCNWLIAEFPDPAKEVPPRPGSTGDPTPPGYVNNRSVGGTVPGSNFSFAWVTLDVHDCMLNLRHSPCHSTLGSLEQCILGLVASTQGKGFAYGAPGCARYWADPECAETVLQSDLDDAPATDGSEYACLALPVEPNVTCPATTSDGGTD